MTVSAPKAITNGVSPVVIRSVGPEYSGQFVNPSTLVLFKILLQILLHGLVGNFYLSIALGVPGGGEYFLCSELLAKCDECRIVKLLSILCDYSMGESESAYNILPQKIGALCLCLLG